jgi:hypothetical protein
MLLRNMFRLWRSKRRIAKQDYGDHFQEFGGRPSIERIRDSTDLELHEWLSSEELSPTSRSMAQSELRIRESWRMPAMWSVAIAALALMISIISLVVSLQR